MIGIRIDGKKPADLVAVAKYLYPHTDENISSDNAEEALSDNGYLYKTEYDGYYLGIELGAGSEGDIVSTPISKVMEVIEKAKKIARLAGSEEEPAIHCGVTYG
jgi:hypothetical protein